MRGISKQRMKVNIVRVKKGCKLTNVGGLVGATVGFNEGEPVVGACKMHKGKCVLGSNCKTGIKTTKLLLVIKLTAVGLFEGDVVGLIMG